jgi:hypothetical protein
VKPFTRTERLSTVDMACPCRRAARLVVHQGCFIRRWEHPPVRERHVLPAATCSTVRVEAVRVRHARLAVTDWRSPVRGMRSGVRMNGLPRRRAGRSCPTEAPRRRCGELAWARHPSVWPVRVADCASQASPSPVGSRFAGLDAESRGCGTGALRRQ